LHEFYHFCKHEISPKRFYQAVREIFIKFLTNQIKLVPLLSRQQRNSYQNKIKLEDPSDNPHVISSLIYDCRYIITYNSHFAKSDFLIKSVHPEELIKKYAKQ